MTNSIIEHNQWRLVIYSILINWMVNEKDSPRGLLYWWVTSIWLPSLSSWWWQPQGQWLIEWSDHLHFLSLSLSFIHSFFSHFGDTRMPITQLFIWFIYLCLAIMNNCRRIYHHRISQKLTKRLRIKHLAFFIGMISLKLCDVCVWSTRIEPEWWWWWSYCLDIDDGFFLIFKKKIIIDIAIRLLPSLRYWLTLVLPLLIDDDDDWFNCCSIHQSVSKKKNNRKQ